MEDVAAAVSLPVDVEESEDAYAFIADVPGLEKGDIKVRPAIKIQSGGRGRLCARGTPLPAHAGHPAGCMFDSRILCMYLMLHGQASTCMEVEPARKPCMRMRAPLCGQQHMCMLGRPSVDVLPAPVRRSA